MNRFVGVAMCVVVSGSSARGDDALATLEVPQCTVAGVIGDDVVVGAGFAGVFLVPRKGGAAQSAYVPAKAESPRDMISFHVLGGHIIYQETKYHDDGAWSLEYLGLVDAQKKQGSELADPFRNWAMTADDRNLYWADVDKSASGGSTVFRVALTGGDKVPAFDVPGQVQQLAAYKGTLYATTLTENGRGALGSTKMCYEVHRQQGKRSKRLGRRFCEDGGGGGLVVSATGVYFVSGSILRKLPLAGGKETSFDEVEAAYLTPWTSGDVVVWQRDRTYFVADAAAKKLAPRKVKQPGDPLATYAVSGDHIFWTESDAANKHCTVKRATLE